jgi:hypothetical protein
MQKIWAVESVDTRTGARTIIATTLRGEDAQRIAQNAGQGEGYTIETRLY